MQRSRDSILIGTIMKNCPDCAEEIQDEAVITRFFGRELPATEIEHQAEKTEKRSVSHQ